MLGDASGCDSLQFRSLGRKPTQVFTAISSKLSRHAEGKNYVNGWKRLALVASVLVATGIGVLRYEQFPTQEKIAAEHRHNIMFWRDCNTYFQNRDIGKFNSNSPCSLYKRQNVEQSLQNELEAYKYKLSLLPERRVQWAAITLGFWAGINVATLIIIFTVLWVYRGFRPKAG
jgi:hypothetical protein